MVTHLPQTRSTLRITTSRDVEYPVSQAPGIEMEKQSHLWSQILGNYDVLRKSILSHSFSTKEEGHKHSSSDNIGSTVTNAVVICMVTDGNYISHGVQCIMNIIVESLCRTPETNI